MGLLLPHICAITVFPDMVVIRKRSNGKQSGGGARGEVTVFSGESRYRLFCLLHSLEFKTVTFATLTYPREFPEDPKVFKNHLREYHRRMVRKYGKIKTVWRLEFQKRGAPHYHLMMLDAPYIPISDWCNLWSDVIGTQDVNHRKLGVDVKLVTKTSQGALVASYMGKYVGKLDQTKEVKNGQGVGRYWGKWDIQKINPIEVKISSGAAEYLVSKLCTTRGDSPSWQPRDATSCTIFGNSMGSDNFCVDVIRQLASAKGAA